MNAATLTLSLALLAGVPGREQDAAAAARTAERALAAHVGQRIASTAGRNEPCPCGSGRKFKKCCMLSGNYDGMLRNHYSR